MPSDTGIDLDEGQLAVKRFFHKLNYLSQNCTRSDITLPIDKFLHELSYLEYALHNHTAKGSLFPNNRTVLDSLLEDLGEMHIGYEDEDWGIEEIV